jgi:hypothetical protein
VGGADSTRTAAETVTSAGDPARIAQVVSTLEPSPYPEGHVFGPALGALTPPQMRRLSDVYGPGRTPRAELDAALVDEGAIRAAQTSEARRGPCRPPGERRFTGQVVLRTDGATTLSVQRFGDLPVPALQLPPRSEVVVGLGPAGLDPEVPGWRLQAVGACVVGP